MKTCAGKARAAAAVVGAVAASLALAINAAADPPPVTQVPDPQGPGCDAFKAAVPNWKDLNSQLVGSALASIPDISTFNALISGQANPAVDIVPVLNNGPYVVFAPTNEAFAAMEPGRLDAIKADPAMLTKLGYYHAFLGQLGPETVQGQRRTQDGAQVKVTGKGGDITVNDTAKNICGGIQASNAFIYMIDTVLDPAQAPAPIAPAGASSTEAPPPQSGEPAVG